MPEVTPLSPERSRSLSALARARACDDLTQLVALSPEDPAVRTQAGRPRALAGASAGSVIDAVAPGTTPLDPLTYK